MLELLLMICAYTDFRYRKIPNICVALIGLYAFFISPVYVYEKVAGFVLCFICMLIIYTQSKDMKGGDIKFLLVTAGALGMMNFTYTLLLATIIAVIYSITMRKKSVPLAFMFALGNVSLKLFELFQEACFYE